MATTTITATAATGVVFGVLTHLQFFIRGEWERYAAKVTAFYALSVSLSLPLTLIVTSNLPVFDASLRVWTFWTSYAAALFASIGCYRIFFHPLKNFPGPSGAKLSGLWSFWETVPRYKWHEGVREAHAKYGDFVRIRPRELSINNVNAIRDIHGVGTVCSKGPMYDLNYPARSVQMTRDKAFHSERRKLWDRGFSTKALSEYEPRVRSHCSSLLSRLTSLEGKPVDIGRWISFMTFDVMGDLAFGKSFNMVNTEGAHFVYDQFRRTKSIIGALSCIPWGFILLKSLPLAQQKSEGWTKWCAAQIEERLKMSRDRKDLFSYILRDDLNQTAKSPKISRDLIMDSELAIVAGSDTSATTLTAAVFLIATHQEKQKLLQQEVDRLFSMVDNISHQQLIGAPMLEGCLHEALRLYPPVPSGVQRMTPPEGANIAGQWVPGDTLVSTPTYTLHRDARYFAQPDAFIPERWTSKACLVYQKEAFNPFLTGAYSCAGRPLAWMEMRIMLALLVRTFDIQLSEDHHPHDGPGLFDKQEPGFRDFFVAECPPLRILLSNRF